MEGFISGLWFLFYISRGGLNNGVNGYFQKGVAWVVAGYANKQGQMCLPNKHLLVAY